MNIEDHKIYLEICENYSALSKCAKHKVGALIVRKNRIISNGVNGTPSEYVNCCDKFKNVNTHIEPYKSQHKAMGNNF